MCFTSTFARPLTVVRITYYGPVYDEMGSTESFLTIFQSMYEKLKYCVKVQCVKGFDGHSQQHGGVTDF